MGARCQLYVDHVTEIATQLVTAAGIQECDVMLGVPTTRGDLLRPYLEAARSLHGGIVDLTTVVRREPGAGSTSRLSFAERQAQHKLTGPLPAMRRLLILDDFLATGESAAHVIEVVRHHAAAMPEVVIAAALWVPPEDLSASFLRLPRQKNSWVSVGSGSLPSE
jgi:adenine/guanine phosphoribosyltransferase-like PRPP-binding protein